MKISTKYKPKLEIAADVEILAQKSLNLFVHHAKKALNKKDAFYIAISGGHTPKRFFQLIGDKALNLPWDKIHLFWVDERYVPPESNKSNYRLAADTFLKKVPIPDDNVHRIPTEYSDFKIAALNYAETIRRVFNLKENELPEFDLIILGMGIDGHTGSLFPNSYAPFDTNDLVCVLYVLDDKLNRITLTHPVLCAASHLVVLVSGKEKANIFKEVLASEPDDVRYPIHMLWPVFDKVTWLADKEATKLL